jgi:hypothetical protein
MTTSTLEVLRHPDIGPPYFQEIYNIRDSLGGLFSEDFSFKEFFPEDPTHLPAGQYNYFNTLIQQAEKRPVLQLCRSSGRLNQLKSAFSGLHIHLWREPRTQWWSYLIDSYFENTINLIAEAPNAPSILKTLLHPVSPINEYGFEQRYKRFFALWLYAFIENLKFSDLEISIDLLDAKPSYKETVSHALATQNIKHVNFDDCKSPFTKLTTKEIIRYKVVEDEVFEFFHQYAHADQLNLIKQKLSDVYELKNTHIDHPTKYRDVALRLMSSHSNEAIEYHAKVNHALSLYNSQLARAKEAEVKLKNSEDKLEQTIDKLKQTEANLAEYISKSRSDEIKLENNRTQLELNELQIKQLEARQHESQAHINQQAAELAKIKLALDHTSAMLLASRLEVESILSSNSWKMTEPLRWVKQKLSRQEDINNLAEDSSPPSSTQVSDQISDISSLNHSANLGNDSAPLKEKHE